MLDRCELLRDYGMHWGGCGEKFTVEM